MQHKMHLVLLFAAVVGSYAANLATLDDLEEYGGAVGAPAEAAVDDAASSYDLSATADQSSLEFTPCNVNDPNRNECIKSLFELTLPRLKEGLPAYNMGSLDPYFYRRGIFRYANDGIQGGLLIKNMHIHGISDLKVTNVLSNFTDNHFVIKISAELPLLKAGGNFKADVKFGGLRLVPKGLFNITIDNIRANAIVDGFIETAEFGQRLQLNRLNANVAIGNARIAANGIFSDSNLNTMILNLVNENLPEITRVGIPATRDQWAPVLVEHINGFFANVPIDKFLMQ